MSAARLEAYGLTSALRAATSAQEEQNELPARVTAVHKERYALVSDRGECYGRLKSAVYYNDGTEPFPTTGDFVLIQPNDQGDSVITKTLPPPLLFRPQESHARASGAGGCGKL